MAAWVKQTLADFSWVWCMRELTDSIELVEYEFRTFDELMNEQLPVCSVCSVRLSVQVKLCLLHYTFLFEKWNDRRCEEKNQ